MQKISIYLFEKHIADMYQDDDRVYLKQTDDMCNKELPILLKEYGVKELKQKLILIEVSKRDLQRGL